MNSIFSEAFELLKKLELELDLKGALIAAFQKVLEDHTLIARSQTLYKNLFDRKEALGTEIIHWEAQETVKELFTVVIFTRGAFLRKQKTYDLPDQAFDALYQVLRFVRQNKTRRGTWLLNSSSLYFAYSYTFPRMFQLGRLVFEMLPFPYSYNVYQTESGTVALARTTVSPDDNSVSGCRYTTDGLELMQAETFQNAQCLLQSGDPVLGIHVPGNEKLDERAVQASFEASKLFFNKYFPKKRFHAYVCSSWLLDTELENFLPETSNILKFQRRFTVPQRNINTFAIYDSIFQVSAHCPLEALVPKNRFQSAVLTYVSAGGNLHSGQGYILIPQKSEETP